MARKPDIQYIGQFYVHGSEAQKLAPKTVPKKAKTRLPLVRLQTVQKIYVDPVALCGMLVAAVMLVVMVMGVIQIQEAWDEYGVMSGHLSELKQENAQLRQTYQNGYDLEAVRSAALALGMVPASEVRTIDITVTVPEPVEEPSVLEEAWEDFIWFIEGLFA